MSIDYENRCVYPDKGIIVACRRPVGIDTSLKLENLKTGKPLKVKLSTRNT